MHPVFGSKYPLNEIPINSRFLICARVTLTPGLPPFSPLHAFSTFLHLFSFFCPLGLFLRLESLMAEAGQHRHPCPQCGKTYKQRKHLNRHLKNECGVFPQFQCPFCPTRIARRDNLTAHVRHKHREILLKANTTHIPNISEIYQLW